jgi:hypothetical protein
MIIYRFGPYSKNDLTIQIGKYSALDLINLIGNIERNKEIKSISAIKNEGNQQKPAEILLKKSTDGEESIAISNKSIELIIDSDSIEYLLYKIEEYIKSSSFSPPEWINIENKKTSKSVQIYLESVPSEYP